MLKIRLKYTKQNSSNFGNYYQLILNMKMKHKAVKLKQMYNWKQFKKTITKYKTVKIFTNKQNCSKMYAVGNHL